MPYDEPDETDPMMLVGVELPAGEEAAAEACRVLAEEYARMGFDEAAVMAIFRDPFYSGPHQLLGLLGEARVLSLVRESSACWAGLKFCDRDTDPGTGLRTLPVLDAHSQARRDHHV